MRDFFAFISNYYVFGLIPLDIILHFILGAGIYLLLKLFLRPSLAILGLFFISLIKEIYDADALSSSFFEHSKDLAITHLYPVFSIFIGKYLAKKDKN